MPDVIFYEVFDEEKTALEKFLPAEIDAVYKKGTVQEEGGDLGGTDLISIRTQSRVPDEARSDLKGILTRSQGFDHISVISQDQEALIACGYLPDYCASAVAEQAIMMLMALWRKLPDQTQQFNTFNRDGLTGRECGGRNLLVVGVGKIGRRIIDIGCALGMNVKGVDIDPKIKNLEYVILEEGVLWAEAVVCALPLTDLTRGRINYGLLSRASPGLILINIARGEIAPLCDMKKLLDEGVLGGLGMDVYPDEDVLGDSFRSGSGLSEDAQLVKELAADHRTILTPHNAFNTEESLSKKASLAAESIVYFLEHKAFPEAVPSR